MSDELRKELPRLFTRLIVNANTLVNAIGDKTASPALVKSARQQTIDVLRDAEQWLARADRSDPG